MLDEKKQTNKRKGIYKTIFFFKKKKVNSFSLDSVLSMKVCGAFQRSEKKKKTPRAGRKTVGQMQLCPGSRTKDQQIKV